MRIRHLADNVAHRSMAALSLGVLSLAFLIGLTLFLRSRPVLAANGIGDLLLSSVWHPMQGRFGLAPFIIGTLWVTGIAMTIGVPLSLLTAVYLSEYATARVRRFIMPIIDVLAGISPVVYGVWGLLAIVPVVRDHVMPLLGALPLGLFRSDNTTGFSALAGGIVLSVMVAPLIIAIADEVMRNVPFGLREASLALGTTRWETTRHVVLRKAWPGIIAAVILGLSRAFGETMAVLMVAGCTLFGATRSIFDPVYPLPALIANTYGEMMSVPLYDAAILLAAFILFAVVALFNMLGWSLLLHVRRRQN